MSNRKFHGECHKTRHAAGHPARCTCGTFVACDIDTTDPELFVKHLDQHSLFGTYASANNPYRTPAWVRTAGKPWKAPRSAKPWQPRPFDVGDVVQWIDRTTNTVMTGQVWSGHPAPKTKWVVADSNAYAVHERDLLDAWLSDARARIAHNRTNNSDYARNDVQYWTEAVAAIERQLAERELQAS